MRRSFIPLDRIQERPVGPSTSQEGIRKTPGLGLGLGLLPDLAVHEIKARRPLPWDLASARKTSRAAEDMSAVWGVAAYRGNDCLKGWASR